ncbi:MAG: hypothetical protein R8G66_30175 [Cytophagales bacterium]|nr:hypothetical protein [Cytophagales bacterium]
MLEQELKDLWRNSPETERIKFDLSRLMIDLNGQLEDLNARIKRRDRMDIITMLISIPVFSYLIFIIPFPVTKAGLVLAILGMIWHVFKRRDHYLNRIPVNHTLSFKEQLENQKLNLEHEKKLMSTVLYWFLIPSFVPFAVSVLGLGDPQAYGWSNFIIDQLLPMPIIYKLAYLTFAAIVFTMIYRENNRVVRRTLMPMIREIEEAQQELSNDDVV